MMKGDNILLTRIDNRLVHGQVGVTWTKTIGANLIVVCDEEAANDQLQQQLMTFTAKSSGVGIRFFTVDFTAQVIDNASPDQKIFLVVKTPATVRALIEKGVHLKDINVGNMHFSNGKRALTKKVYVDDQDMADLKFAAEHGSNVYCQDVPGDSIEKIQ
ncbi:PTS galactosamine transporter subunit IIB [Anaerorhabdus sp.]|jgi:galactosamine PTS system EIIB component|nr:PTS galactosamine transporter subunit IIB [Anaerorhabdus sp.]MEA4875433.1 PTS galactosamine transporter subunit IIB [Anaerorhabdus sp.]